MRTMFLYDGLVTGVCSLLSAQTCMMKSVNLQDVTGAFVIYRLSGFMTAPRKLNSGHIGTIYDEVWLGLELETVHYT